jgi:hypothetical protein
LQALEPVRNSNFDATHQAIELLGLLPESAFEDAPDSLPGIGTSASPLEVFRLLVYSLYGTCSCSALAELVAWS